MRSLIWGVCKTPYGVTFIGFLLCQITFAVLLKFGHLPWAGGIERGLSGFLMISVYLLVTINTIIFIVHLMSTISSVSDDNGSKEASYGFAIGLLVFSIFVSGALALAAFLAWYGVFGKEFWYKAIQINEVAGVALFSIFLIADLCYFEFLSGALCKLPDTDLKKPCLKKKQELHGKYILGVDLSGLIGLLFILFLSHLIYSEGVASGTRESVAYWQGFTTGAIALHISFSQAVLASLSAKEQ